jgi:hypothetical protein
MIVIKKVLLEMQAFSQEPFPKRILLYWSKLYSTPHSSMTKVPTLNTII